jgi:hypothetical protein
MVNLPVECKTDSVTDNLPVECKTDTEMLASYQNGLLPAELTENADSHSDPKEKRILTQVYLNTIIKNIKHKIPTQQDNAEVVQKFLQSIREEFQFYNIRYHCALNKLFKLLSDKPQSQSQSSNEKALQITVILNRRLNDLTQIINEITKYMLSSSTEMKQDISKFNDTIQQQKQKLENQNALISSTEASVKIKKQMVKYTEEKARRTDNLLKLYSVLNIVALGLLVYIYKAADE